MVGKTKKFADLQITLQKFYHKILKVDVLKLIKARFVCAFKCIFQ